MLRKLIKSLFQKTFCLSLAFLDFYDTKAQNNFTTLISPGLSLNIPGRNGWTYQLDLANRNEIWQNEQFQVVPRFVQLSGGLNRKIGESSKLGGGLRYRNSHLFDESEKNELRLVEQFDHVKKRNRQHVRHRVRFAQRFRDQVSYRLRYLFGMEFPLHMKGGDQVLSWGVSAEIVSEIGKERVFVFDQRYSSCLDYRLAPNTNLNLGLEYRYRDFTNSPYQQLFLLTELEFSW